MDIISIVLALVVGAGAAVLVVAARRPGTVRHEPVVGQAVLHDAVADAVGDALGQLRADAAAHESRNLEAAVEHLVRVQREHAVAVSADVRRAASVDLSAKKDVIDARLDSVQADLRTELDKLGSMVATLAESSAQKFGEVEHSLRSHAEVTSALSESAQAIREAMANSAARGQWGERMAEDVLRMAGFVEHVNYEKQAQLDGGTGRPDFTFPLPKGHELYMDVKFPMSSYLRFLDANTDAEREAHRHAFLRDVRARVKELAQRDYARESARRSVDYVLLFLPNETLTGFIHENDPELIDHAMEQRVVMCSPLTLFAFLGVIRQAHDNFVIEQTSDEILSLLARFGVEWRKYNDQLDKVRTKFDQLDANFDTLLGTRRRQLDKPLAKLDELRRERNLPIAEPLVTADQCSELDGGDTDRVTASDRWRGHLA